jgi:hypothetical protein
MVAKVSENGVAVDRFEYTEDEIMTKQKQIQRKFLVEKNLVAPQVGVTAQGLACVERVYSYGILMLTLARAIY